MTWRAFFTWPSDEDEEEEGEEGEDDEDDEEDEEEEEEEEGEEGGAGADADDPGGLQALLRRLGGGLEDLMPAAGHTHGRLKTILTGLRAAGDEAGGSLSTSTRPTLNPLLLLLLLLLLLFLRAILPEGKSCSDIGSIDCCG